MEVNSEKRYMLSLSEREAGFLMSLCACVGGNMNAKPREFTTSLYNKLEAAGAICVDGYDGRLDAIGGDCASSA